MDVACFLNEIADKLARTSMSSRELFSLDFEADGRDISVRSRPVSHPHWYPPLGLILAKIGSTCVRQGIAVAELRRIIFGEREVILVLVQRHGRPGATYSFPIETTVGLPASDFSAAAG